MLTNYDPDSNIDNLTDIEIYAAIRYLEPDISSANAATKATRDGLLPHVVLSYRADAIHLPKMCGPMHFLKRLVSIAPSLADQFGCRKSPF